MPDGSMGKDRRSAPPAPPPTASLYKSHQKIYPKAVRGTYRRLKWSVLAVLLAVFHIGPWVRWNRGTDLPDQAVLADLDHGRLFFFNVEIWPQEIYYLTGLLVLAAVGLFMATALFGRIWCGYGCPQTVWTDLFVWIEHRIEGDRAERIRLDKNSLTPAKLARKLLKHAVWLLIGLVMAITFVGYITDAPTLIHDLIRFDASLQVTFFIGLFVGTTYLFAGYAREQICIYMCPWPRIQAGMLDEESLVVTYQAHRGEARGPKRKSESWEEHFQKGFGDCIDCTQCVQVCPVGIDIRDGIQADCINCGLCVDACNGIMARINRPGGLITYDSQARQAAKVTGTTPRLRLIRPRTIVYSLLLLVVGGVMIAGLVLRPRLDISVIRERAPLFVVLQDGAIRNTYTIKVSNMTHQERRYILAVEGLPEAAVSVGGLEGEAAGKRPEIGGLLARQDTVSAFRVQVRVPAAVRLAASTPIHLIVTDQAGGETADYTSVFLAPDPAK